MAMPHRRGFAMLECSEVLALQPPFQRKTSHSSELSDSPLSVRRDA